MEVQTVASRLRAFAPLRPAAWQMAALAATLGSQTPLPRERDLEECQSARDELVEVADIRIDDGMALRLGDRVGLNTR